jgi:alpha-galactosidase
VQAGAFEVVLEKEPDNFEISFDHINLAEGLELVRLRLTAAAAAVPGLYRLSWGQPLVDIHGFWRPGTDQHGNLPADWGAGFVSQSTTHAPVGCLFNLKNQNRHTWAFSDALNPVEIGAGVNEETATFRISLTLFQVSAPFASYEATLRLDTRPLPYYQSLSEVQAWWAGQPGYQPAPVPAITRQPMYSTWYSFHQRLEAAEVEKQCRLAAELGCEAVIVDDGWQTSNNQRGYAYCGDWEVWQEKIPDMQAHVARVHEAGLKFILWYALPFIGPKGKNFGRFEGKYLNFIEHHNTWVLDPRFPEVREFLINLCEEAQRAWGIDGFKIDFVQDFKQPQGEKLTSLDGRDYASVPVATDRLLSDLLARLRQANPEVVVEFRQPYIGPLMRKYGNMFRAGDCPNDSLTNRVHTLDIRLLAGNTTTHSDMLMWHPADPVESAALQIISVLFAVPQISVLLDKIPAAHQKMLAFWLAFWRQHQDLLLDGELRPLYPASQYPLVEALRGDQQLLAFYANVVARPSQPIRDNLILVNGTSEPGVILELTSNPGKFQLEIRNCMGEVVETGAISLGPELHSIAVPAAGVALLKRV